MRTKDKLIETTARIIREEGFKEATVRTIAERSHVNIASICYILVPKRSSSAKPSTI